MNHPGYKPGKEINEKGMIFNGEFTIHPKHTHTHTHTKTFKHIHTPSYTVAALWLRWLYKKLPLKPVLFPVSKKISQIALNIPKISVTLQLTLLKTRYLKT